MAELDIEAIKARAAAATPGSWCADPIEDEDVDWFVHSAAGPDFPIVARRVCVEADAEFIAHAPADIAALLAEVERLRGLHADGCVQTAESLRTLIRAALDVCDRLAANAATNPSQVVAVATMVIVREIRAALGVSA